MTARWRLAHQEARKATCKAVPEIAAPLPKPDLNLHPVPTMDPQECEWKHGGKGKGKTETG